MSTGRSWEKNRKFILHFTSYCWDLLVAQTVKKLLAMQETQVPSLGWKNPLEKGMATCSSILAWRISWAGIPGGLQSTEPQRIRHDWATKHALALDKGKFKHVTQKFWILIKAEILNSYKGAVGWTTCLCILIWTVSKRWALLISQALCQTPYSHYFI